MSSSSTSENQSSPSLSPSLSSPSICSSSSVSESTSLGYWRSGRLSQSDKPMSSAVKTPSSSESDSATAALLPFSLPFEEDFVLEEENFFCSGLGHLERKCPFSLQFQQVISESGRLRFFSLSPDCTERASSLPSDFDFSALRTR